MFEIKKGNNGQYFFTIKSGNNEKLITSETYTRKHSAKKGLKALAKQFNPKGGVITVWDRTKEKKQMFFLLTWGKKTKK